MKNNPIEPLVGISYMSNSNFTDILAALWTQGTGNCINKKITLQVFTILLLG